MRSFEVFDTWLRQEFPNSVFSHTHDAVVIWGSRRTVGVDFQFLDGVELRYTKLYKDTWDEWQHATLADPNFFTKTAKMIHDHLGGDNDPIQTP